MTTITAPPTGEHPVDLPAPGAAATGERGYRYPGSPPFRDTDLDRRLFKGRDEEAKKVFHSILSADVFLLYAVSGMGKSSLLNAGVMHRLRARGYWPVNIRLNDTVLSPVQAIDRQIEEADLRDTEVEVQRTPGLDFDITDETTLWDLLGSLEVWRGDRLQQLVLVLDQFEELFTLDWSSDVRDRFIAEFGQVVRGHRSADADELAETAAVPVPNVKFCIVIREDALGQLEALADDVPQIMQNRFRLGALDASQAERAIREPAMVDDGLLDTQPFGYSEEAARNILDFLQETERAATLRLAETSTDHTVDPSQLQIVCQYVERRVLPTKGTPPAGQVVTIEAADLGGAEGLRSVLGDFYRRTVGTFPPATQRSVQRLCEEGLISKSGRRLSIERDEIAAHYEVSTATLDELVDQRLLRVEPRVGSAYYELSHDTLVRPILADRAERRKARSRRHRRFAFIAGGVAALLVLVFLAYRIGFDEGSDSVASIEFETPLQGEVGEPGDVERFQVAAREQPSLVLVEPSEEGTLNASVTLINSRKARRDADQLPRGDSERIVVPAGAGNRLDVAVSSKDASTGGFAITQGDLSVTPLLEGESEGDAVSGTIDEPGSLVVYSVDVAEPLDGSDSSIEIVVNSPEAGDPSRNPNGKPDPGLDVEIEVIDPRGTGTITDSNGAGGGERTTLTGDAGQYLVVVRGDVDSTGEFELTASPVTYTTVSPVALGAADESVEGEVEFADVPVAFAIDVAADSAVDVTITPTGDLDLDLVVEVVGPNGTSLWIDNSANGEDEFATLTGEGRHSVRVGGYEGSVGSFELTASSVTYATLPFDEAVEGEVESADVPTAFALDVPSDNDVGVTVTTSSGDLDLVLEIVDPAGTTYSLDSSSSGETEFVALTGAGLHQVRVSGYEGSIGSFEIVAAALDSAELVEGESLTAIAPVVFDVEVGTGDLLSFDATSDDPESVLSIQVIDPDGFPTGSGGGWLAAGQPATALLDGAFPGTYKIVVGSAEPDTNITATMQPVESVTLVEDEPVTVAAPASFDVEVVEGQTVTFIAEPEAADGDLTVSVQGADGFPTGATSTSPSPGESASVSLGGGAPGSYRIIVNYSGAPTDVTVSLQPAETESLAFGSSPVAGVAPTIFDIEIAAGEQGLVILTPPQGDDSLWMTISSPGSDVPSYVYSPGPGQPLTALLTGEGTHEIMVDTSGGDDGSFTIEARAMDAP